MCVMHGFWFSNHCIIYLGCISSALTMSSITNTPVSEEGQPRRRLAFNTETAELRELRKILHRNAIQEAIQRQHTPNINTPVLGVALPSAVLEKMLEKEVMRATAAGVDIEVGDRHYSPLELSDTSGRVLRGQTPSAGSAVYEELGSKVGDMTEHLKRMVDLMDEERGHRRRSRRSKLWRCWYLVSFLYQCFICGYL